MLKTRVTKLLEIEYPIIQGGMIWNSGYKLASAVSEAGGLGLIGSGSMDPEVLRAHIRKAFSKTKKPFGVNIPLIYSSSEECIRVCREEGIKIYFTSAGSPKKYTHLLKSDGAKVFHVISNSELAKKCEDAGVDGVVAEGFEAGGHNGRDELTTFVLIPEVVESVKIPVVAAGGICKGSQILSAMVMGAEGVQVGSRFAVSWESSSHQKFKDAVVSAKDTDTFLLLKKIVPVRLLKNDFALKVMKMEENGASYEELSKLLERGRAKKGMFEGDLIEGELEIGQGVGMIKEILSVKEIMNRFIDEYNEAFKRINSLERES